MIIGCRKGVRLDDQGCVGIVGELDGREVAIVRVLGNPRINVGIGPGEGVASGGCAGVDLKLATVRRM